MVRKISTLPLLGLPFIILAFSSCRKNHDEEFAQSGLRANRVYYCDTVLHEQPMRMFTQAGEVTDAGVVNQYLALHPYIANEPPAFSEMHPYYIHATQTREVRLNGVNIYDVVGSISGGAFEMQQRDTNMTGQGTSSTSIDLLYQLEQQYRTVRDAVLEMNRSHSRLERVDSQNYRYFESLHVKGTYTNEVIALPYTFVASRFIFRSYPFALKAGAMPLVAPGDTVLVQAGRAEFKLRQ